MGSRDVLASIVEKVNSSGIGEKELSGFNKTFQFKVSDASPFYVKIENGKVSLNDGEAQSPPSATISATDALLTDLFNGKVDAVAAFMQGKLRVSGDIFSAQKLTSIVGKYRK
ncbi:SCP2 sterol-binding domain-containing protein [Thermogymnomonas acidicola]|uniref:SCP2 sterol-binding domain-containing protein n=1 Tax=Thermogymnomonas acidicola TaxID=399579 RepID=UPI00094654A6|nr:SCP2 sterol-binding domain-containing protein [Thermogymnomonas acidicola]